MSGLYFYDDAKARDLEPFALTRPACELRAGALLVRERWERVTGLPTAGFIGAPHLDRFDEEGAAGAIPRDGEIPAGSVLVNSRFAISLREEPGNFDLLTGGGITCAVRLARSLPVARLDGTADIGSLQTSYGGTTVNGEWIADAWDYMRGLSRQLAEDIHLLGRAMARAEVHPSGKTGDGEVFVDRKASVGPYVVFDTTAGPILIESGVQIHPFTRLGGPLFVGRDSTIMGDRIEGSSIGPHCKVRGELSHSIILGYSNKSHEGFVGHSYLGRWVNLGALTTTSNLKNTYGTVQFWTPSGVRDSGLQFLGTYAGDHAKTGIGLMLNTGTVIGAGANVFGSHMPPKTVAPFSWGDAPPYAEYDFEKFLVAAERMMQRRRVTLTDNAREQLRASNRARRTAE